jgi:hypothetical protein
MRQMLQWLSILLILTGCGTFNIQVQTLRVQEATATQVANILQSRTPPSVTMIQPLVSTTDQNLSPANFPTQAACQIAFFWGDVPGLCPDAEPVQAEAAFQVYDKGYMLWENITGSVYVLYNGGQGRKLDNNMVATWPEVTVQTPPPSNHVHPLRGFGRVWQHEADIQTGLGWPLGLEQAYTAQFQTVGVETPISYFYVSLPNGQVIEYLSAGVWRIIR